MSASSVFACQSCGRHYPWKSEFVGRKARCKCGEVLRVPSAPQGEPESDLYDLTDEARPAAAAARRVDRPAQVAAQPASAPIVEPAPAASTAPRAALSYPTADTPAAADPSSSAMIDPLKDIKIPIALLIAGIAVQFVVGWIEYRGLYSPVGILAGIGIQLIVGTTLMLIAAFIAARFMGLAFGPFWIALLKLSAVAVASPAMADFLYFFLQYIPILGGFMSWILSFLFYFALLGMLFDLDQNETLWLVLVIFLVRLFAAIVVFSYLMGF
jgi:hypothetical protein